MYKNHAKADRWTSIAEHLRREAEIDAYERLIQWYFPVEEQKTAIMYVWQVSRMDARAVDVVAPGRYGLFQLTAEQGNVSETSANWLLNPIRNVALAYRLVRQNGWQSFNPVPTPEAPEPTPDVED